MNEIYAPMPEPDVVAGHINGKPVCLNHSDAAMRAYADATHALREAQRPPDSWRDAVEHELTVLELSCPDDPKKAIQDLISWHCKISLDPAVSSDAQALVDRGRDEAQRPQADAEWMTKFRRLATVYASAYFYNLVTGNPEAEADQDESFNALMAHAAQRPADPALASRPVPSPISEAQREPLTEARIGLIGLRAIDMFRKTKDQHMYIVREVERINGITGQKE